MKKEIDYASDFIVSLLKRANLQKSSETAFKEALQQAMYKKFSGSWDLGNPRKANAYRSLFTHGAIDPIILSASRNAGISDAIMHEFLPLDFVLWCDPGSVSYRLGEHGNVLSIYDDAFKSPQTKSYFINENGSPQSRNRYSTAPPKPQRIVIKKPPAASKAAHNAEKEPEQNSPSLSPVIKVK